MCNLHANARKDPTRTLTIRERFERDLVARMRRLNQAIMQAIEEGLLGDPKEPILTVQRFTFETTEAKMLQFARFLRELERRGDIALLSNEGTGRPLGSWANIYIDTAYKQGIRRAKSEMRRVGVDAEMAGGVDAAFNLPIHADRVGVIYSRVYSDLDGITQEMDKQISRVLAEAMINGQNPLEAARLINDRIEKIGITRARTLARTEMVRAHHQANMQEYRNAGLEEVEIVAEWLTAGDSRVCPLCAPLNGKVYTLDAAENMIPRHPNCFVSGTMVKANKVKAASERWYSGDFVTIRTASDKQITCTVNHPILTTRGWVAAGLVDESSHVISSAFGDDGAFECGNNYDVESLIEKVSDSLRGSLGVSAKEVKTAAPDFHGDGINGNVAIIRANSELADWIESASGEHLEHISLVPRVKPSPVLFAYGAIAQSIKGWWDAFCSRVASKDLIGSLFSIHLRPFKALGVRLVSPFMAMLFKQSCNDVSGHPKKFGGFVFRGTSSVHRDDVIFWEHESVSCGGINTGAIQDSLDDLVSDAKLAGQIRDCAPRGILVDDVVSVIVNRGACHVYNLQTESGAYLANGIISHNCRCVVVPVPRDEVDGRKIRKTATR